MKTDDLIAALSGQALAAPAVQIRRSLWGAAALGAVVAMVLLVAWLGMRPLDQAVVTRAFWMKATYTACLALIGLAMVGRLARPGRGMGSVPWALGVVIVPMIGMGGVNLLGASPQALRAAWLGTSWSVCPWRILALATPAYLALMVALRRFAPTRLRLAGAAAGLVAGGVGATVYGLYCQESTAAFVATWYSLGIAAAVAIGAVIGGRALRW